MPAKSRVTYNINKRRRGGRIKNKSTISRDNVGVTSIEISLASLEIENVQSQLRSSNVNSTVERSTTKTLHPNTEYIEDSKNVHYRSCVASYKKDQTVAISIAGSSHQQYQQQPHDKQENKRKRTRKEASDKVAKLDKTVNDKVSQKQYIWNEANNEVQAKKDKTFQGKGKWISHKTKQQTLKNGKKKKVTKFIHKNNENDTVNDVNDQETKEEKANAQNLNMTISDSIDVQSNSLRKTGEKLKFPDHVSFKKIQMFLKSNDSNVLQYVQGNIRINPRFHKHAYIEMADGEPDLLIIGLRDRNRALEGDLVVACINPQDKWHILHSGECRKTGTIICILEKVHPRKAIGHLKERGNILLFQPRDRRMPVLKIYDKPLYKAFQAEQHLYKDVLFLAEIVQWRTPHSAIGRIIKVVGNMGDMQAEIDAIILENALDITPYDKDLILSLPDCNHTLTTADIKDREDWREKCVFTIDPTFAVDLDDAVSCELLDNGNYEVGVHISDVTHYLEFSSPLDLQVAKRGTTVYMPDNAYHMLPPQLCELCSLLPGQDKLTFSVVWEMTPDAKVIKHRFVKSIINSCCQMSYNHAQRFIENPNEELSDEFLNIKGNYALAELSQTVNNLYKLSTNLRRRRFDSGALRIDQPKLHVIIDKTTGLPISYKTEVLQDSNRLIEEFMLLANTTVATHLYNTMPDTALLRNHNEPSERILMYTRDMLQKFGIHLDIESSGSLQSSLKQYIPTINSECDATVIAAKYRMMVINMLCFKAMSRALYKCASSVPNESELRHYALSVPFYTHFTSPIRRYPDCVVHRLLYASIQGAPLPKSWNAKLCAQIAQNCNVKKYSAKMAQKQSTELYFTYLISLTDFIDTIAVVMDIKEHNVDVILCDTGIKLCIYPEDMDNQNNIEFSTKYSIPTLTIVWKKPAVTQVINIFSIIHVRLQKHSNLFRLNGTLLPP